MGGYLTYGFVENMDNAESLEGEGVPQLTCDGLVVQRKIKKNVRILLSDCIVPEGDERFALYRAALASGAHCSA